jgi:hypothetical protein
MEQGIHSLDQSKQVNVAECVLDLATGDGSQESVCVENSITNLCATADAAFMIALRDDFQMSIATPSMRVLLFTHDAMTKYVGDVCGVVFLLRTSWKAP